MKIISIEVSSHASVPCKLAEAVDRPYVLSFVRVAYHSSKTEKQATESRRGCHSFHPTKCH